MTTLRVEKRSRFATIDRRTVNDRRLSFGARGLLLWLLDKPDDWITSTSRLCRESPAGKAAISSILHELEALGYLVRSQARTEEGKLGENEWIVREIPEPLSGFQSTGEPSADEPSTENRSTYRRLTPTETEKTETDLHPERVASLPEKTADVVKLSEKQALARAVDVVARDLLGRWWETQDPRPTQNYVGCLRVVKKFLEVGWSPEDVFFALNEAPNVSTGTLTYALRSRQKKTKGTQTDALISMMVTLDGMSEAEQEEWWNTKGFGRVRHG